MSDLHQHIKGGKSAKEIAKLMKVDVKTIEKLMKGFNEKVDPADVDDEASEDDIRAADKNIIYQMRKAIQLRGGPRTGVKKKNIGYPFKVIFLDKKKVEIKPQIAQAIITKYNSFRRPADKEEFQAKIAKSYKDMLAALKESLDEGTWTLPDTPKQKAQLKKVMKKPIILGKDGDDAVEIMYGLIGDDGLLDDLHNAGEKDPKGDARPLVRKYMKKFGIKEDTILDRINQKIRENKNG